LTVGTSSSSRVLQFCKANKQNKGIQHTIMQTEEQGRTERNSFNRAFTSRTPSWSGRLAVMPGASTHRMFVSMVPCLEPLLRGRDGCFWSPRLCTQEGHRGKSLGLECATHALTTPRFGASGAFLESATLDGEISWNADSRMRPAGPTPSAAVRPRGSAHSRSEHGSFHPGHGGDCSQR
jgi:hypothetical protein